MKTSIQIQLNNPSTHTAEIANCKYGTFKLNIAGQLTQQLAQAPAGVKEGEPLTLYLLTHIKCGRVKALTSLPEITFARSILLKYGRARKYAT